MWLAVFCWIRSVKGKPQIQFDTSCAKADTFVHNMSICLNISSKSQSCQAISLKCIFHNLTSCFSSFSQLRAQNQVLKKAVVDEQANSVALKVEGYSRNNTRRKVILHNCTDTKTTPSSCQCFPFHRSSILLLIMRQLWHHEKKKSKVVAPS